MTDTDTILFFDSAGVQHIIHRSAIESFSWSTQGHWVLRTKSGASYLLREDHSTVAEWLGMDESEVLEMLGMKEV